jgi:hypothetical protein
MGDKGGPVRRDRDPNVSWETDGPGVGGGHRTEEVG